MNRSEKHTNLVNEIITQANARFMGRCYLEKRIVGKYYPPHQRFPLRFGKDGQADITGSIVRDRAETIEIEVKTGLGKRTKEQVAWRNHCDFFKKHYFLARSLDETLNFIENLLK